MDAIQTTPKKYVMLETLVVYAAIYLILISSFTLIGRQIVACRGADYYYLVALPIDFSLPYLPSFVYFYKSLWIFPLVFGLVWFVNVSPDQSLIRRIFVMFLTLYGFSALWWVFFPVSCYAIFPDAKLLHSSRAGLALWEHKAIGTMWSAFPSFHCVSIWMLIRLAHKYVSVKAFNWFLTTFGLGIVASTLFVKVHYLADIVAGIALAEVAVRYFSESQHALQRFARTSDVMFVSLYLVVFVITAICLSSNPNRKDYQQMIDRPTRGMMERVERERGRRKFRMVIRAAEPSQKRILIWSETGSIGCAASVKLD
jgi:membrane-associated phospholipid phosphatase